MSNTKFTPRFLKVSLFRFGFFLSVAHVTVASLVRLGISVRYVSTRSQYLVRLLSVRIACELQIVTQSIHLLKESYPKLILNP